MWQKNLNDIRILTEDDETIPQSDYSTESAGTKVYFKNLERRLIEHINESDLVFGCVAWLTSHGILDILKTRDCSIVVQKEDFLRPDTDVRDNFRRELRERYDKLGCSINRYWMPGIVAELSTHGSPEVYPIRCVGNHNTFKNSAHPRSHHKFVIFAKLVQNPDPRYKDISQRIAKPYAVWTGSFNFTKNAGHSFENAVYLTDPKIVEAFCNEFAQVYALSESLDWEQDWAVPEYRIGS